MSSGSPMPDATAFTALAPVSVGVLCDFTARQGDLDLRFTPAPAASEGLQGHARMRARREASHAFERPVTVTCAGLAVRGRVDAVAHAGACVVEFKTHRGDLARMSPGLRHLHWAQLRCYGAMLAHELGWQQVRLQLVYENVQDGRESCLEDEVDAVVLWAELTQRCVRLAQWLALEQQHRRARDAWLDTLPFPRACFRPGQREAAEAVYKTLARQAALLLQAPTGLGKTLATLYPALRAMARQDYDRLVFLTMRGTGRDLARQAVQSLLPTAGTAAPLRVLTLVARDQACEHPGTPCHGEACPLARGFFDRLDAARAAALPRFHQLADPLAVRALARQHAVCPYYLTQSLAHWADVIVADANYWFDQQALLPALAREHDWRVALLVDEGHQLVARARAMYGASLSEITWRAAHRAAPRALRRALRPLATLWQAADWPVPTRLAAPPAAWVAALQVVAGRLIEHLAEQAGEIALQTLLFEILAFLRLADVWGDDLSCVWQVAGARGNGRRQAVLRLECLVPARFLTPRWGVARASVVFSATLTPYRYHRDLLGLPDATLWLDVPTPFRAEQLEVRLVRDIDTRLAQRASSAPRVAARVLHQFAQRPGNYLVYASSFQYADMLAAALARSAPALPLRLQTPGMTPLDRQAFVDSFVAGGRQVGVAVLGGAFGEGIDLPGDRLYGAFIVSLGLPPHDEAHEAVRRCLGDRFGAELAYAYTYRYPGLQKVIQAAGRVLRTPDDAGVIELLDSRFQRPEIRALLPRWWSVDVVP